MFTRIFVSFCLNFITINASSQLLSIPNPLPSPTCGSSLSSRLPSYYDDWTSERSWSASIYNRNYFSGDLSISSIQYFVDCSVSNGTNCSYGIASNQRIFLGHINSAVFNNGNRPDSDADIENLTEVYNGNVQWVQAPVASGGTWTTISFDTPFNYDQSKHLVVYFVNENGGSLAGSFLCQNPGKIVEAQGASGTKYSKYANTTSAPLETTADGFSNQVPIVRFQTGAPLPVELSYFNVTNQNGFAHLSWQTISERNNDRFEIEKSTDLKKWSKIGSVLGNGNSTEKINYSFTHSERTKGIEYFRICQIDFDGTRDYASIKSLIAIEKTTTIFPNPASQTLTVQKQNIQSEEIQLFNQIGQNVTNITSFQQISHSEIKIDLSNLRTGIYFVEIDGNFNKIMVAR